MLKFTIFTLLTVLIVLPGTAVSSQVIAFAARMSASEAPPTTSEPAGDVVTDLDKLKSIEEVPVPQN